MGPFFGLTRQGDLHTPRFLGNTGLPNGRLVKKVTTQLALLVGTRLEVVASAPTFCQTRYRAK